MTIIKKTEKHIVKTNGIHYYVCSATSEDYNVYYNGKLIARERNNIVKFIK